jgi:pyruvate kinase
MSERGSKTRIIATIGPASSDRATLERMIEAGMNVARLNFAHGELAAHGETIGTIRAAAAAVGRRVAILADLPGPKLRIGRLADQPTELARGQNFTISVGAFTGDATRASTTFAKLPEVVKPGNLIFLNDGLVQLRVERIAGQEVQCEVAAGGPLMSNKGINLPEVDLGIGAFTERDKECLEFALTQNVDAIGQSFVQSADDVLAVRSAARAAGGEPLVFAKIERAVALDRIDEILTAADGIMIARGDLGVEIPIERIAVVQKDLIRKANLRRKPAITATQMLLSMVESRRPTRAEVTDVANAILDGTDCVMLSEESAIGAYPVEAVEMLGRVALAVEPRVQPRFGPEWQEPSLKSADNQELIAASVARIAERIRPLGVFVPTETGATVRLIAAFRLPVWITAASRFEKTCQDLQFVYGVQALHLPERPASWQDLARDCFAAAGPGRILITEGAAGPGEGTNRFEILTI